MQDDNQKQAGQSLFSVFKSVSASMFGVQSSKQHKEDFAKGSIGAYIVVGLVSTLVFILAVWGLVKFAVKMTAGA